MKEKRKTGSLRGQGIRLFYCKTAGPHGRGWALAALPIQRQNARSDILCTFAGACRPLFAIGGGGMAGPGVFAKWYALTAGGRIAKNGGFAAQRGSLTFCAGNCITISI